MNNHVTIGNSLISLMTIGKRKAKKINKHFTESCQSYY